jgi:uncharacterized glyoxalase superfamily protein PhnB
MTDKSYGPPQGRVLAAYLCCREAGRAIDWYGEVLGARLLADPFVGPDGRIGHAELAVDGASFMLSDSYPEAGVAAPEEGRLPTYAMHLYVPDVDATTAAAERGGATVESAPTDQFDGRRSATVVDPFGVRWMLATQVRQLSEDEFAAARADFAGD